jgi:glycosyltransferase involved in cell wall biosynthesis
LTGILDGEADVKVNGHQVPEKIPHISVVVPTYRNGELLRRCLDALLAQRIDPEAFEVIVVDDGREDSVRDQVLGIAEWIQAPRVRYLRPLHGRGAAGARNRGWRAAKGALVAFTHDDTVPDPDWLMAGVRAFENNRHWVGLSGRVVVPVADGAHALTHVHNDGERSARGATTAEFVTANAFVWRTALEAVGGFDERFTRTWREDSDLQFGFSNKAVRWDIATKRASFTLCARSRGVSACASNATRTSTRCCTRNIRTCIASASGAFRHGTTTRSLRSARWCRCCWQSIG